MMGFIEWRSKEGWAMERAIVTRCIAEQGIYRVEFASGSTLSEGLLEFTWGRNSKRRLENMATPTGRMPVKPRSSVTRLKRQSYLSSQGHGTTPKMGQENGTCT